MISYLDDYIIYIAIISITAFCIIFLIRSFIEIKIEKTRAEREEKKKQKKIKKEEEDLFRKKEEEDLFRKKEEEKIKIINKTPKTELSPQIVDFVKPIGFWTSMVLGQKLTHLINSANIMNEDQRKGFWVRMVEAQDRAAGRQRGRSR